MNSYFVLLHNFNTNQIEKHDIMPYLIATYEKCNKDEVWWMFDDASHSPVSTNDFIHFVKRVCMHRYWSRCEYEWQMIPWPPGKTETLEDCQKVINSAIKIDAWEQIEMNLEIVTNVFMDNVKSL